MRTLVIGGTGLISVGIVKHLLARGAEVTVFNRGRRASTLPDAVQTVVGDRDAAGAFDAVLAGARFDAVIDMVCFNARQADAAVAAFGGRCDHYVFCSTVCTYGIKSPPNVFVDETFPQEPISDYGRNKVAAERVFMAAHEAGKFAATVIRPSNTYGPGSAMIDNLEGNAVAWDRIEQGLPVLCAGDGLGLWVSTHRDDCGKLFAYGAGNPKTFGQSYNATRAAHTTWREYYRQVAAAMGREAQLILMPAAWIVRHEPARFGLLREITQYHGAYDSSKAARDVPEFQCEIDLVDGARQTLDDARQRGALKRNAGDVLYQSMVDEALKMGVEPVTA